MRRLSIIATVFLMILSGNSFALRCDDGQIVNEGDSRSKVLKDCGSPTYENEDQMVYEKNGAKETVNISHGNVEKIDWSR